MNKSIFKTAVAVAVTTAAVFCVGCSEKPDEDESGRQSGGGNETDSTFVDSRDGNNTTYNKVKIGNQVWMAENLNYNAPSSVCYENSADNCVKYGRLYVWNTAKTVCPAGWHLPTVAEWKTLANYGGGEETAGTRLKSSTGWPVDDDVPAGTDNYGFSALPGGIGYDGNFHGGGNLGSWWGATEGTGNNVGNAVYLRIDHDEDGVRIEGYYKTALFSVRCLRN